MQVSFFSDLDLTQTLLRAAEMTVKNKSVCGILDKQTMLFFSCWFTNIIRDFSLTVVLC